MKVAKTNSSAILPMQCCKQGKLELHNCDNVDLLITIQDESVDIILTDPPYLYLKGQKLERPFDEQHFFSESKRVLTKDGFIVLFGRGESFYRWNTILADMGFKFKEEIVWNKSMGTSPLSRLCRVHETISIHCKGKASINKIKVPYLESKGYDLDKIHVDIKRITSSLKNATSIQYLEDFIAGKRSDMELNTRFTKHKVTSDVRKSGAREVNTLASIQNGLTEKSIININRDHFNTIHPTQKPVRLLERILALVLPKKDREDITVLDPFGGSFSTMEACINIGVNGVSCEIDKDYFEDGLSRIKNLPLFQKTLFK
ncbi:DNA-methyltransferase [Sphingobacterium spiritivorum]|uniref:DNA-methyltransferase n=1 Tax=Sphingobacterium spiritivorum TaxID=258 RepID=UPI003DA4625D